MQRPILRRLAALVRRLAPGWHPLRSPLARRLLERWIAARRPEVLATRHGFDLRLPRDHRSPLVVALYLDGEYEPEESRRILELLRPGDLAFDVGANVGYMTCLMARAVAGPPAGEVFAFEPEPTLHALLLDNVARNRLAGVSVERLALSSAAGEESLYLAADNCGDHTLVEIADREAVVVLRQTFDAYFAARCAGRRARLVKIDVQGHEIEVLKGMTGSLRAGAVEFVLLEFWPARVRQSGAASAELFSLLRALPYRASLVADTAGAATSFDEIAAELDEIERRPHRFFTLLLELQDRPPARPSA